MSMGIILPELSRKVLNVLIECDFLPSSKVHLRIAGDIQELGLQKVLYLAENFSPSQLGRMGYLGARWLAICRRDYPQKYKLIKQKLQEVLG